MLIAHVLVLYRVTGANGDGPADNALTVLFFAVVLQDGALVVQEYTEDGCTGEPTDVTTQYLEDATSPGSKSSADGEDTPPDSKEGGDADGPSMDQSGSKSAEQSGSKSGSADGPDGPSMDQSGSGSKSADASGSKSADASGSKSADASGSKSASDEVPDWADAVTDSPDGKEAFGCDDDDTDCFTPEPKGFDVTDEDWNTPEPKGSPSSGSKSGSKSGSASADGPSMDQSGSGSKSADASGSKSGVSGDAPDSKEGGDAPDSKEGAGDAPDSKEGAGDDAPDSKEGGLEIDCIEMFVICFHVLVSVYNPCIESSHFTVS